MLKGTGKFIIVGSLLILVLISIWLQPLKKVKKMTRDNWNQLLHPSCVVKSRTEHEVLVRTRKKLKEISQEQKIDNSLFLKPPDISFDKEKSLWIVDYNSTESHFFRFTIDVCGFLETSIGKSTKIHKIIDGIPYELES